MEISINGEKARVAEKTALLTIVNERLGGRQNGVAVAVNASVIPKAEWGNILVQPNDDILIIKATQGG
jgi:sulfur carrier protein